MRYSVFLGEYAAAYPRATARDYYKFIHQSVFGIGHLIADRQSAQAYLEREIAGLQPAAPDAPDEPLLQPLDPESRMVRVNLRPFVDRQLPVDRLVDAMMASAQVAQSPGARDLFLRRWRALAELIATGEVPLTATDYSQLDARAAANDYPAMHHSDLYRAAYRPAYRVVYKALYNRAMAR